MWFLGASSGCSGNTASSMTARPPRHCAGMPAIMATDPITPACFKKSRRAVNL